MVMCFIGSIVERLDVKKKIIEELAVAHSFHRWFIVVTIDLLENEAFFGFWRCGCISNLMDFTIQKGFG